MFKDKGSRFISFAHPVHTLEESKRILESYRKDARFKGACHFCYAYKLGIEKSYTRSSDHGEPSGTAGRPILNQIESYQLSDIIVVVIRFFGGTLLGTSGLINAYKQATIACLKEVVPIKTILRTPIELQFPYSLQTELERIIKGFDVLIIERKYEEQVNYHLQVKKGEYDLLLQSIQNSDISKLVNLLSS